MPLNITPPLIPGGGSFFGDAMNVIEKIREVQAMCGDTAIVKHLDWVIEDIKAMISKSLTRYTTYLVVDHRATDLIEEVRETVKPKDGSNLQRAVDDLERALRFPTPPESESVNGPPIKHGIAEWLESKAETLQQASGRPMFARCSEKLKDQKQPYPRTCEYCGLGPCAENYDTTDFPTRPCRNCGKTDRPQYRGTCNDGHCGEFE